MRPTEERVRRVRPDVMLDMAGGLTNGNIRSSAVSAPIKPVMDPNPES